jgi:hypothetical protein
VRGGNGHDLHMRPVEEKIKEPVGMVDRCMVRRKHDTLELRRQKISSCNIESDGCHKTNEDRETNIPMLN